MFSKKDFPDPRKYLKPLMSRPKHSKMTLISTNHLPDPSSDVDPTSATSPKPATANPLLCRGNIEKLEHGFIIGWLADVDGNAYNGTPRLYVDGKLVGPLGELLYRDDLNSADIADGFAMFKIDCTRNLAASSRKHLVSIVDDDKSAVLLEASFLNYNHEPLNPNISLTLESNTLVKDWLTSSPPEAGLRLEQYSAAGKFPCLPSKYTRFTFTESHPTLRNISLSCILTLPELPLSKNLEIGLLMRSDRYTNLSAKIMKGSEVVSELSTYFESYWRPEKLVFQNTEGLELSSDDRYTLNISIQHAGRSFIDVGYICVAEYVSESYIESAIHASQVLQKDTAVPVLPVENFIENGDFTKWSHGLKLGVIKHGDPLADNWQFHCVEQQRDTVELSLRTHQLPNTSNGSANGQSFGLRIKAETLIGTVRLESSLDMRFLDQESLKLKVDISSLENSRVSDIHRLYLQGISHDRKAVLHVISRKLRVRAHSSLDLTLNESDMTNIRRKIAGFQAVKLCMEFQHNTDIFIKQVALTMPTNDTTNVVDTQLSPGCSFEDPAIICQLSRVKGLRAWSENKTATHECFTSCNASDSSEGNSSFTALKYQQAKIRRPKIGYPTIDIVIPIHNALVSVKECIRSVMEKTTVPYSFILVDDFSDTPTTRFLKELDSQLPNLLLLRNNENLGYTKTVNRALIESRADMVCILNSDCIVTDSWLEKLIDCAAREPSIGMVGPLSNAASYQSIPKIFNDVGGWCFNPLPSSVTPDDVARLVYEHSNSTYPEVRVINGFCQLIKREVFEQIGLLDEESFPRGFGEENDYCARALKEGFKIVVADDTYVYHTKSQSFGHEVREKLSQIGAQALKKKHPDIDWSEIVKEIQNAPGLVALRAQLTSIELQQENHI